MAEREIEQPTTSRSSQKICWLAALDELEQEFVVYQQRRGGGGAVHSDAAAAGKSSKQIAAQTSEAETTLREP